jgi:hypothetical protein
MAALEFARFHATVAKTAPKKADERTTKAIQRALSERWSFKRVQAFCRSVLRGTAAEGDDAEQESATARSSLFTDGTELRIRRRQLSASTPVERAALVEILRELLSELTP